jgi:uncharacterized membrane protein YjgN (DUF898 family)
MYLWTAARYASHSGTPDVSAATVVAVVSIVAVVVAVSVVAVSVVAVMAVASAASSCFLHPAMITIDARANTKIRRVVLLTENLQFQLFTEGDADRNRDAWSPA